MAAVVEGQKMTAQLALKNMRVVRQAVAEAALKRVQVALMKKRLKSRQEVAEVAMAKVQVAPKNTKVVMTTKNTMATLADPAVEAVISSARP